MSSPPLLSVSELNRLARLALERALPSCWVAGEISNLSRAASGHWYFTLKDTQAGVRCAMFRNRNQFVDWLLREGEQVEVRAQPTLYEARGDYQLIVDAMRRAGAGALFEAFLKLKAKLEREGLFAPERKRALPRYPRSLGVITSIQAAALRDVLSTLKRRWPAAAVDFEKIIAVDRDNGWAHCQLGKIYRRQGRWAEAAAALGKARELDPKDIWARLELGALYLDQGRFFCQR